MRRPLARRQARRLRTRRQARRFRTRRQARRFRAEARAHRARLPCCLHRSCRLLYGILCLRFGTCSEKACRERMFHVKHHSSERADSFASLQCGGVAEWLKAAVLKTVNVHAFVGSNPTASAIKSFHPQSSQASSLFRSHHRAPARARRRFQHLLGARQKLARQASSAPLASSTLRRPCAPLASSSLTSPTETTQNAGFAAHKSGFLAAHCEEPAQAFRQQRMTCCSSSPLAPTARPSARRGASRRASTCTPDG